MATYGPVTLSSLATTDLVSPGAPVFISGNQVDNTIIRLILSLPVMDADGSSLSGLTKLTVVSAVMTGGVNPFTSMGMTEILALPGTQKVNATLTPADAGQQKTVDVTVMNLGGTQAFAAACAD